jgi:hypothetical protein
MDPLVAQTTTGRMANAATKASNKALTGMLIFLNIASAPIHWL